MRTILGILQKILAIVGAFKLPSDLQSLWKFVRDYILPYILPLGGAGVSGWVFHFLREAPGWQVLGAIVLTGGGIYLIQLLVGTLGHRRHQKAAAFTSTAQPAARQPINEDLRERCCKLSAEIREFYKRERENAEQTLRSDIIGRFSFKKSLIEANGVQKKPSATKRRWWIGTANNSVARCQICAMT